MSSQKAVKAIYLVYENMEGLNIPLKYIGDFWLGNITQRIRRTHAGAPDLCTRAEEFWIEIDRSFDREKMDKAKEYNSITSLIIDFDTDEEEEYFVPFGSSNNYRNTHQTTYFNKHGDLFIAISANPEFAKTALDKELIDHDHFRLSTIKFCD